MKYDPKQSGWSEEMLEAIAQMQQLISQVYPGTSYATSYQDDPAGVHMIATVDTEDLDAVIDCFIDRLLTLQVEKGIPLYIIPVRPANKRTAKPQPDIFPLHR